MRLLGVDPGLRVTGYAVLEAADHAPPTLVEAGAVRLVRAAQPAPPVADRLVELERDLLALVARARPDAVAVERLFSHQRYPEAGLLMGHARGVILLVAARLGLDLLEIEPASVKKAITGSGRATKRQMQLAVQAAFGLPQPPSPPDVADAIAIAHAALTRGPVAGVLTRAGARPDEAVNTIAG